MIEVLVSDLGQVLLPIDWTTAKQFLRERCRKVETGTEARDPWSALSEVHERLGFGRGECTPAAFYAAFSSEMDLDASFDEFCHAWCDVFREDPRVMDLIRRARVQRRLLLSNTNEIHWNWILQRYGTFLAPLDRLLVSQELKSEKPHEAIYRQVEALTGLPPSAHLMIDDLSANVEGAQRCGWDGIVFTDAAQLEAELKKRDLL